MCLKRIVYITLPALLVKLTGAISNLSQFTIERMRTWYRLCLSPLQRTKTNGPVTVRPLTDSVTVGSPGVLREKSQTLTLSAGNEFAVHKKLTKIPLTLLNLRNVDLPGLLTVHLDPCAAFEAPSPPAYDNFLFRCGSVNNRHALRARILRPELKR